MNRLNTFQRNNLLTGTYLATEILSSSPELRAFVVIGAYVQTPTKPMKPSKSLNVEQDNLRFWIRRYEIAKRDIDKYVTEKDLQNAMYINNISSRDALEHELEKYVDDFSLMEVTWKVDNPLP